MSIKKYNKIRPMLVYRDYTYDFEYPIWNWRYINLKKCDP